MSVIHLNVYEVSRFIYYNIFFYLIFVYYVQNIHVYMFTYLFFIIDSFITGIFNDSIYSFNFTQSEVKYFSENLDMQYVNN